MCTGNADRRGRHSQAFGAYQNLTLTAEATLNNLNLRHLHYFWVISRLGSVVAAADHLELTPQTLSGQLASLEAQLGGALFHRANRALQLTDFGHTVFSYADEMFKTAQALSDLVIKPAEGRPLRLAVGICASIHKLIAYRLLKPALELPRTVKLRCQTGDLSQLLKCLHQRSLNVILSDRPPADKDAPQVRCYALGRSSMSLFAVPELAQRLASDFPQSLNHQPFLATALDAPYITELKNWFASRNIAVNVVAEVDDSALIKVFGHQGVGYFAAPTVICDEVCRQYRVAHIAIINEVQDTLFAITRDHGSHDAAVQAIIEGPMAIVKSIENSDV